MKGRPIDDISEIFTVFKKYDGKILCEIKYDGERAQIHYEKDKIFSFSRNFELQNEKYRNLLDKLKAHLQSQHIENCIIDCEIIGFDYSKLQMLSFQELMTKKENSIQLEGKIYCFDLYYLNSESLLDKNLIKRRNQLFSAFKSTDFFVPAEGFELDIKAIPQEESLLQINDFLADTLDQGYEGIFLKTLDEKLSVYMGNTRVQWIKVI